MIGGDPLDAVSDFEPDVAAVLEPGEQLRLRAAAMDAVLAVTDRRLVVAARERIALAVPFQSVRRIQFDIERDRPATLVIVPEMARDEPQVLSVPPERYAEAAAALVAIGHRLAGIEPTEEAG
jgi:hypothetical protein